MEILEQIKMKPFPAVRSNGKWGRFTPRAKEYHNKMNTLRLLIQNKEEIIKGLIEWELEINFYFKTPKSWNNTKKKAHHMMPHRSSPDIDNLYKAVTDTLFYNTDYNDREIHSIRCDKLWSDEDMIEFNYFR